jgi:AraC-like DNA-binding protein
VNRTILQEAPASATSALLESLLRHAPEGEESAPIPQLRVARSSKPTKPTPVLYEPALCIVAQGKKVVALGDEEVPYDATSYLLNSVALPIVGRVVTASRAKPLVVVRIPLLPAVIEPVLRQANTSLERTPSKGIDIRPLDPPLLDAVLRLVKLADTPEHAPVLAPLILHEIVYRLLVAGHAARLQHIVMVGGRTHRVARAIAWIRERFDQTMRVEQLAKQIGMSPSGLHFHFRVVTGMSPLQYQKTLRLHEARRLLLAEDVDAATAGFRVGYNDPSQFTREYRRLFGAPPLRDVARLRATA